MSIPRLITIICCDSLKWELMNESHFFGLSLTTELFNVIVNMGITEPTLRVSRATSTVTNKIKKKHSFLNFRTILRTTEILDDGFFLIG